MTLRSKAGGGLQVVVISSAVVFGTVENRWRLRAGQTRSALPFGTSSRDQVPTLSPSRCPWDARSG
jgi:hypothetical protein